MPIIKSAKKRVKQAAVRTERNNMTRSLYRGAMKRFYTAIEAGDKKAAEAMIPHIYKTLDTAAKKNVIHTNKAARHKSQVMKALSK
ncbi:MAG: 30S ribosomal protein S20 [Patescibacteria group bacterium]|nr:30S ribosomal protein S20 [Patescibacteria group bacterium]